MWGKCEKKNNKKNKEKGENHVIMKILHLRIIQNLSQHVCLFKFLKKNHSP